jgi:hypothetical protein
LNHLPESPVRRGAAGYPVDRRFLFEVLIMSSIPYPSNSQGIACQTSFARTITAIDMTGNPGLRGLWFPGPAVPADLAARATLPAGGQASPLGYWLVTHDGLVPSPGTGPRLVVTDPAAAEIEPVAMPGEPYRPGRRFQTHTVKIKAPNPADGNVVLTIAPGSARVVARESVWQALAEPILLVVCQVWRFQAIDEELERLTRHAMDDLEYANAPGLGSLGESRRLMNLGWKTRAAIVDLTYFEMPLTDPHAYFTSRRSARVYRRLVGRFGLDEWCQAIDHRAEVVETTFETITEKLYHLKSHAHDVALEIIIVVILLIDILMRIWELMV